MEIGNNTFYIFIMKQVDHGTLHPYKMTILVLYSEGCGNWFTWIIQNFIFHFFRSLHRIGMNYIPPNGPYTLVRIISKNLFIGWRQVHYFIFVVSDCYYI